MKKYIFLIMILSLLFCGQAMAEKQTFDSKLGKFIIDVPDGWSAEVVPEGCKIISKDEKNILSLQLLPAKKIERESIANDLAKELNITVNKKTEDETGVWLEGELAGAPAGVLSINVNPTIVLVCLYTGTDFDAIKKMVESGIMASDEVKSIEIEAGPIWNNDYAKKRCPEVLEEWLKAHPDMAAEWTGEWRTTIEGKMSVCNIKVHPK